MLKPSLRRTAHVGFGYAYALYEMVGGAWRIKSTRLARVVVNVPHAQGQRIYRGGAVRFP